MLRGSFKVGSGGYIMIAEHAFKVGFNVFIERRDRLKGMYEFNRIQITDFDKLARTSFSNVSDQDIQRFELKACKTIRKYCDEHSLTGIMERVYTDLFPEVFFKLSNSDLTQYLKAIFDIALDQSVSELNRLGYYGK